MNVNLNCKKSNKSPSQIVRMTKIHTMQKNKNILVFNNTTNKSKKHKNYCAAKIHARERSQQRKITEELYRGKWARHYDGLSQQVYNTLKKPCAMCTTYCLMCCMTFSWMGSTSLRRVIMRSDRNTMHIIFISYMMKSKQESLYDSLFDAEFYLFYRNKLILCGFFWSSHRKINRGNCMMNTSFDLLQHLL